MVLFIHPQESKAGQTFENRHQKKEATPQLTYDLPYLEMQLTLNDAGQGR